MDGSIEVHRHLSRWNKTKTKTKKKKKKKKEQRLEVLSLSLDGQTPRLTSQTHQTAQGGDKH